jgi:hypothetical protein
VNTVIKYLFVQINFRSILKSKWKRNPSAVDSVTRPLLNRLTCWQTWKFTGAGNPTGAPRAQNLLPSHLTWRHA